MGRSSKLFKTIVAGVKTLKSPSKENGREDRDQRKGHKERCLWSLGKSTSRKRDIAVTAPFSEVLEARAAQKEPDQHLQSPSPLFIGDLSAVTSPSKSTATERNGHVKTSEEEDVEIFDLEEKSALKIQAAFRCYLARSAYNALKALVRIQALVRGRRTRKHAAIALRCIRSLVRVQALARGRRIRKSELGELVQKHLQQAKQQRKKSGEGGTINSAYALTKSQNRQDAVMKRQRALVHALCEQSHRSAFKKSSSDFQPDKGSWAWIWLDLLTRSRFSGIHAIQTNGQQDLTAYTIEKKAVEDKHVENSTQGIHSVQHPQANIVSEPQHAEKAALELEKKQDKVFIQEKDVSYDGNGGIVEGNVLCSEISLLKNVHEETPLNMKNNGSTRTFVESETSKRNGVLDDLKEYETLNAKTEKDLKASPAEREEATVNYKKASGENCTVSSVWTEIPPVVDSISDTIKQLSDVSTESHDILCGVNLKPLVTAVDGVSKEKMQGNSVCKVQPTVLELMNPSSDALTVSPAQFESPARQSPTPSSAFSLVGCYSPSQPTSPASISLEEHGSPQRHYDTATLPSVSGGVNVTQQIGLNMNGDSTKSDLAGTGNEDEATSCMSLPANGTHELIQDHTDHEFDAPTEAMIDEENDLRLKQDCHSQSSNQEHNTPVSKHEQHNHGSKQAEQISPSVPNYMATTKSSMAKARSMGNIKQKQDPTKLRTDSPKQKKHSPKFRGDCPKPKTESPQLKTDSPNLKTDSPNLTRPDTAVRKRFSLSSLEGNTTMSPMMAHRHVMHVKANSKGQLNDVADSPGLKNSLQVQNK